MKIYISTCPSEQGWKKLQSLNCCACSSRRPAVRLLQRSRQLEFTEWRRLQIAREKQRASINRHLVSRQTRADCCPQGGPSGKDGPFKPLFSGNPVLHDSRAASPKSHHEILRLGMVHNDGRGRLFRLHVKTAGQPHVDRLFRFQQGKDFCLVLQVRARRITKRVT